MIARPKDAATVMLIRESHHLDEGGLEVLMVLRHPESMFVPSCYVYPGGCLDEDDCSPEMASLCTGIDRDTARRLINNISPPEAALGAWVAGIRETFEEVGLLLAYERDGSLVSLDSEERIERFSAYRWALCEGKIDLKDMLRKEELTLAADRLHYFSHWITPELLPLRYDVRFFVAEVPDNQKALHDRVELTGHVWISPQKALDEYEQGKFDMVLPTIMTLADLCKYKTVDDVIRSTCEEKDIPAILTKMVELDDRLVEVMPDGEVFTARPPEYPEG
ncbi:MAG: hypothetical protein IMF10_06735 [Proteobacteria bacterium]|nr:hypothetical protein [Pseudomonadota bacterium]